MCARLLVLGLFLSFAVTAAFGSTPPTAVDNALHDPDGDGIDDRLAAKITAAAEDPAAKVRVVCCLTAQVSDDDLALLASLGGTVDHVYRFALDGFSCELPAAAVGELRDLLAAKGRLASILPEHETAGTIDDSVRQTRVRPLVWSLGYEGDPNTTVLVLDSGIDESHLDLAGPYLSGCWADFSGANYTAPSDFFSHGTHVASIAVGTGSVFGQNLPSSISTVSDGVHPGDPGVAFYTFAKIPNFGTFDAWLDSTPGASGHYHELRDPSWNIIASGSGPGAAPPMSVPINQLVGIHRYGFAINNFFVPLFYRVRQQHPYSSSVDGFNAMRGVAPGARLGGVKILTDSGSGTTGMMIAGLDWAVQNRDTYNIRVINLSVALLGGTIDAAVENAVFNCANNGILVVCSAGNDYPSATIPSPGNSPYALTVGAVNDGQRMTNYSSNGAPGSSKPDVVAPGGSFVQGSQITAADSNDGDAQGAFAQWMPNIHRSLHGTSMAAPHVAGLAAVVIDALETNGQPYQTTLAQVMTVKGLILMTATETNDIGEDAWNFGQSPTTTSGNDPFLDRGGKDLVEGYGTINGDAAAFAVSFTPSIPFSGIAIDLGFFPWQRRCWAFNVPALTPGSTYTITTAPVGAGLDVDLFVYEQTFTATGEPQLFASSTSNVIQGLDSVTFTADASTPPLYVVVKRVTGIGDYAFVSMSEQGGGTNFIRGDADGNGVFNGLADGLFILQHQFLQGPPPLCFEAADADDDATFNGLADGLYVLSHQFLAGPPPGAPYPACGPDPLPASSIGCNSHPGCP